MTEKEFSQVLTRNNIEWLVTELVFARYNLYKNTPSEYVERYSKLYNYKDLRYLSVHDIRGEIITKLKENIDEWYSRFWWDV